MYFKVFWTQLVTVHLQGPCSLRPCSLRPYCTYFILLIHEIASLPWVFEHQMLWFDEFFEFFCARTKKFVKLQFWWNTCFNLTSFFFSIFKGWEFSRSKMETKIQLKKSTITLGELLMREVSIDCERNTAKDFYSHLGIQKLKLK